MILQTLKMSWSAILSNKLRTFLTMLGIIIGIVALVVLVSIADGAASSVSDQIADMGANLLTVSVNDDKNNPIRLSEMEQFMADEEIEGAAPYARTSVTAKSGYTSGSMTVVGTTGPYLDIQDLTLSSGRFLKQADVQNSSYVVVLNYDAAVELLGRTDVTGETVKLNGMSFTVIGVLARETSAYGSGSSEDSQGESVDMQGYIPYSSLTRLTDNVLYVTRIYASAVNEESLDGAERALTALMLERLNEDEDAFTITNQSAVMDTMEEVNNTLSLMLGGIAAISLLVGGIGIMNIMLVSVTERTREIGIRKAIGAGQGSILLQFLMEALMVSMMGCGVGIGASVAILKVLGVVMEDSMSFQISRDVVWMSVGFSMLLGVVFGLYPAFKAARKKPIEALRYS